MKPLLIFLFIAVLGNVVYHIGQKSLTQSANPMILLAAVYAMALVMAAGAAPFFRTTAPQAPLMAQIFSWPVLAIAAGILCIELGFLLAYRMGVSMQWSGVAVNALAALLLLPVALIFFREKFSAIRTLGIALTLSGLALLTRH